jgi:hypothetical protein
MTVYGRLTTLLLAKRHIPVIHLPSIQSVCPAADIAQGAVRAADHNAAGGG